MKSIHFLRPMIVGIILLVTTALISRHFYGTEYFQVQILGGRNKISQSRIDKIEKSTPTYVSGFVGEDSPSDVVPEMAYLRKYGRLFDLSPIKTQLMNMSLKELIYIYHSYLDNTDFLCHRKLRMGHIGDGGWEVCDDYSYRPVMPCIVYSFGINNDFSFDDEIAKLYGCHVYSFDPSMAVASHNRSSKVHFFKIGLSGKDEKLSNLWDLKTFAKLRAMLQHQHKTIDILKIDIEAAEWPALTDMLRTGDLLTVRQLLIEFHIFGSVVEQYRDRLKQLADLEALGFRRFHTHLNPLAGNVLNEFLVMRSQAYEVYFVNTNFTRSKDRTTL